MDVAAPNKIAETAQAAAVFAPVAPEDFYEAVLDVRGFPAYAGPVEGWGGCSVEPVGDGALASFWTALAPADPLLMGLARSASVRNAARSHLKRSLLRLGRLVAGNDARVLVGPTNEEGPAATGKYAGPYSAAPKKRGPKAPPSSCCPASRYSK